jgi:hypothetical protein
MLRHTRESRQGRCASEAFRPLLGMANTSKGEVWRRNGGGRAEGWRVVAANATH